MSYYYTYYIGYKLDGKYYPLGPYNSFGKIRPVFEKSRSFSSDLHCRFSMLKREEASEKLIERFEYEDYRGEKCFEMKALSLKELGNGEGDFIKRGYFLINEIAEYEKYGDDWAFSECLSPLVYAKKAENERQFGKPEEEVDEEGNRWTPHSAADYSYYAYIDHCSEEYEIFLLRNAVYSLTAYGDLPEGVEICILETEG